MFKETEALLQSGAVTPFARRHSSRMQLAKTQPPWRDTEASRFAMKCMVRATASPSGSCGGEKGVVGRAGARSTAESEAQ
jgi:hypothetical protein